MWYNNFQNICTFITRVLQTKHCLEYLCSLLQLILKTTQQDSLYYYHSLDDEEAEALGGSLIQG